MKNWKVLITSRLGWQAGKFKAVGKLVRSERQGRIVGGGRVSENICHNVRDAPISRRLHPAAKIGLVLICGLWAMPSKLEFY